MSEDRRKKQVSRREFVKKAAYIAPAIVTLQAVPMYAKAGSEKEHPSTHDLGHGGKPHQKQ